ncbi:hypothetical protein, partial [Citrobacter portucalensis]|uniref:hypothetical protein n=1 Tax=Citrobacter portucalensis TaxID=1639133 RepID=UPI002FE5C701
PTQRSSTLFMANSHCQMKATAATGTSHKQAPHHPIVAPQIPSAAWSLPSPAAGTYDSHL